MPQAAGSGKAMRWVSAERWTSASRRAMASFTHARDGTAAAYGARETGAAVRRRAEREPIDREGTPIGAPVARAARRRRRQEREIRLPTGAATAPYPRPLYDPVRTRGRHRRPAA